MLKERELKEIYGGEVIVTIVGAVITEIVYLIGVIDGYLNPEEAEKSGSHAF